jgi:hypothetical protein
MENVRFSSVYIAHSQSRVLIVFISMFKKSKAQLSFDSLRDHLYFAQKRNHSPSDVIRYSMTV